MFGIYIHIPFCLQQCHYCDFATVTRNQSSEKESYVDLLCKEIHCRSPLINDRYLDSLYFGGGTPSLLSPSQFDRIFTALRKAGFQFNKKTEVTVEINPGTLNEIEITDLAKLGVNRFSLGVQTFNDEFLQTCGRRHSSKETRETLSALKNLGVLISMDFLFLLPGQNQKTLLQDCKEFFKWAPEHISPYGLDVPSNHPMAKIQPTDEIQTQMYHWLWDELEKNGYEQYEISNFCRDRKYSKHNLLYWNDHSYWGLGMGAHSYLKNKNWGVRFWNPRSLSAYFKQIEKGESLKRKWNEVHDSNHFEFLDQGSSLTDFCFTSLRKKDGIDLEMLRHKYGETVQKNVEIRLKNLSRKSHWLEACSSSYSLTREGKLFSNRVFEALTFQKDDIDLEAKEPII